MTSSDGKPFLRFWTEDVQPGAKRGPYNYVAKNVLLVADMHAETYALAILIVTITKGRRLGAEVPTGFKRRRNA
jgi:hypothetical protein